jgi:hypothetical protein
MPVPYVIECDVSAGFNVDPGHHKRVGYVCSLSKIGGAQFECDLDVRIPGNLDRRPIYPGLDYLISTLGRPHTMAKAFGVLEKFEWNGGVGDPITLEFYVSQTSAFQMKAAQALNSSSITGLGWWIADFDHETKQWFEQAYPLDRTLDSVIAGGQNPRLDVDLNGVNPIEGLNLLIYKVTLSVAPPTGGPQALHFANSNVQGIARAWGMAGGSRLYR